MSNENKILHKELSYKLQGLFFDIRNDLGSGHKESIYQKAFEHTLIENKIAFKKEPPIKIYSTKKEYLGLYRPDFLIDDKIIIEFKAATFVTKQENARMYDYLRNSEYELAYLVNFASKRLYIKRFIFTNDRKLNLKKFVAISIIFVAISGLFFGGLSAEAASLNLVSQTPEVGVGQEFTIDLMLDTQGENINAVEAKIFFPEKLLKLKEIRNGNSIINFWIKEPKIGQAGIIDFSGIIPGGYQETKGFLFSVIFQANESGGGIVEVKDAKVLLNNGEGTAASIKISNFQFILETEFPTKLQISNFKDSDPPEPFTPEIARDSNIFDGKWFLVFAAQDKGSGIDHYKICERIKTTCVIAESPYVLQNQNLDRKIFVKAIDKNGNERIAILPPKSAPRYQKWPVYIIFGIVIFSVIILIRWLYTKRH